MIFPISTTSHEAENLQNLSNQMIELIVCPLYIYSSRIGFRFSEPNFTWNLDLSQSQNPLLIGTNAQHLKALIPGRLFYTRPQGSVFIQSKNQNFRQTLDLKFQKSIRDKYISKYSSYRSSLPRPCQNERRLPGLPAIRTGAGERIHPCGNQTPIGVQ